MSRLMSGARASPSSQNCGLTQALSRANGVRGQYQRPATGDAGRSHWGWVTVPSLSSCNLYPVSQVVPELPSKMQCCIRHSNLWDFVQAVFRK